MKSRELARSDVEVGHNSMIGCHLGNIAFRVGRLVRWDAEKEQIIGDPEAAKDVTRAYGAPWKLPETPEAWGLAGARGLWLPFCPAILVDFNETVCTVSLKVCTLPPGQRTSMSSFRRSREAEVHARIARREDARVGRGFSRINSSCFRLRP